MELPAAPSPSAWCVTEVFPYFAPLSLIQAFLSVLVAVDPQHKDEWAIVLTADASPEEFASQHDLVHLGSIPGAGADLFRLRTDHHSKGPWKTQRQIAFTDLLVREAHKSSSELPQAHHKRSLEDSNGSKIVWFQQQQLYRRDKRAAGPELPMPVDPLFPRQWHLQPTNNEHVSIDVFGAWNLGYHGEGSPMLLIFQSPSLCFDFF